MAKSSKKSAKSEKSKSSKSSGKSSSKKSDSSSNESKSKKSNSKSKKVKLEPLETTYALRNFPERKFAIKAVLDEDSAGGGTEGASVTGEIVEPGGEPFRYVVRFEDKFTESKDNFTPEMYLHTAVSVMKSQIESHRHVGTLLRIHRDSGLIHTEPLKEARS